ncbi:MAG: hypothetical protein DRJ01_08185, partial [Bacteroidetes bacterium]
MNKLTPIVLLVFICISLFSQQPQILDLGNDLYKVIISIPIENITPVQAKEIAIQKACQLAIEQIAGIEVTGRTSLIQAEANNEITIDHFCKLTNQISKGVILEKEILKEENINVNNRIIKQVTVKLKVGKQTGEADPFFSLSANLNKTYFQNDEELILNVTPSKDCYLTILNIMSDKNVSTVFPNQYRKNNFVKANEFFELPNKNDKKLGIIFKVQLLTDKSEDTEIIKIIATKEPVTINIDSD